MDDCLVDFFLGYGLFRGSQILQKVDMVGRKLFISVECVVVEERVCRSGVDKCFSLFFVGGYDIVVGAQVIVGS